MPLLVTATTHVGLRRTENQDRILLGGVVLAPSMRRPMQVRLVDRTPLAVIDGMGGHAGGSIAALVAAEAVAAHAEAFTTADAAAAGANKVNDAVFEEMLKFPSLEGMGATLTVLSLHSNGAVVTNVGDSRIYAEIGGGLTQLTHDDAAPNGALTQCLGGHSRHSPVEAHVVEEPVHSRYILASDGLFGFCTHEEMESCLVDDDADTITALVEAALAGGGGDNVSIVIARWQPGS